MLSAFANPHRFMKLSRWLAPLCYGLAAVLITWSVWRAIWVVAPDAKQGGDIMRILFLHVPTAWMALASYMALVISSFIWFVWRHELADTAAKVIAGYGALYTALCLLTGSMWGARSWGTWFDWGDWRMVAVLIQFFIFTGYIALRMAMDTRQKAARAGAILAMVGIVNWVLIKFAVDAFAVLHQPASFGRLDGPSVAVEYFWTTIGGALGHSFLFAGLILTGMRGEIFKRRADVIRARRLAGA